METEAKKWFEEEEYHKKNYQEMWNKVKEQMKKIEDNYKENNIFNWDNFFEEIKNMEQTEADKYIKEKLQYMKQEDLFAVRLCAGPLLGLEAEKKKLGFNYTVE